MPVKISNVETVNDPLTFVPHLKMVVEVFPWDLQNDLHTQEQSDAILGEAFVIAFKEAAKKRDYKMPSDDELVRRTVSNLKSKGRSKKQRWVLVMETFGLGSTYATFLCRRCNVDPDELI